MATSKVEICGVDTSTLPVLSNERMRELFPLVHGGDQAAREEFIRGNLRLVLSVVQRFNHRGENVDDLFQVGCIGLMKALDNFDVTQNVRFSTYAVPMIIGEIRRYLRDNNPIRVSRSLRDTAYKALQARDRLVIALNREPTMAEMAQELGVPQEDVLFALEAIQDPISLFEPVYNDGGDAIYIMDQVKDDKDRDESWLEKIAIKEAMRRLHENGLVVYIRLPYEEIERRLSNLATRGVTLKKGQTLRNLYDERIPLYEAEADYTFEPEEGDVQETVLDLAQRLSARMEADNGR